MCFGFVAQYWRWSSWICGTHVKPQDQVVIVEDLGIFRVYLKQDVGQVAWVVGQAIFTADDGVHTAFYGCFKFALKRGFIGYDLLILVLM